MTPMRWLMVLFWLFIGTMLVWQFIDYNKSLDQQALEHPQQKQFFFYDTNTAPHPAAVAQPDTIGPKVEQLAYSVKDKVPTTINFTAHVTLKNVGTAKATGIQIMVCPYKGVILSDDETGNGVKVLSDSDPLSQFGQWVNFPDMAPDETVTKDVVFYRQKNVPFGSNPNPQIIFGGDTPKQ